MASAAEGDVGTVAELARVLRWGFEELSLNKLATSLGASEQALRLIISIFMVPWRKALSAFLPPSLCTC
uniref:Uncharacterized protein n=1 Tax=Ursus americanus TaxID=9643 RepID=A0A452SF56_URSAM